ncbi:MAG TPA: hypothetical protein VG842_08305 [Sediminibacterium sp.]|nr:hypothetical protein [Sediminibacterium sp.]
MKNHFITLVTLAELAGEHPNPLQYHCVPRELILHARFEWDTVMDHLYQLQAEGMVELLQADGLRISLTREGWNAARVPANADLYPDTITVREQSGGWLSFAG